MGALCATYYFYQTNNWFIKLSCTFFSEHRLFINSAKMLVATSLTKWFDWTLIMPRPQYSGRAPSMPGLGALAPCVAGTAACMELFLSYQCSMNKAFPWTAPSQCYEITECKHILHVLRSPKHHHECSSDTNQTLNTLNIPLFPTGPFLYQIKSAA